MDSKRAHASHSCDLGLYRDPTADAVLVVARLHPTDSGRALAHIFGDHFPQDVIAGALIGTLFLVLYVALEPRISQWFATRTTLWTRLAIAITVPLVLATLYLKDAGAALGTLWGVMIGLVLESEWIRFNHHASPAKQIVKLVIGLGIALGLRFGLKAIWCDRLLGDFWRTLDICENTPGRAIDLSITSHRSCANCRS